VEILGDRRPLERECGLSCQRLDTFKCAPRQPVSRVKHESATQLALCREANDRPFGPVRGDPNRLGATRGARRGKRRDRVV
jgi:hypothetical protein